VERTRGACASAPAVFAGRPPATAHDAVARHDDRPGIAPGGGARGPGAAGVTRTRGERGIRRGATPGHAGDFAPDRALERRAAGNERQVEARARRGEVLVELPPRR